MRPWITRITVAVGALLMHTSFAAACPTCTPSERTFTQSLVHGSTPDGLGDQLVVAGMVALVLFTGYMTVRAVLRHDQA